MQEIIKSVGIDIGTSTTQLIFSNITVENKASGYRVPRISIVDKEVVYRSNIYITPLKSQTEIDAEAVKKIVLGEYKQAGMTYEQVKTGAVIITGDTARKENANQVLEALSELAGDFVVATAGPDLESVLSARGAGADVLSEENRTLVVNLDVGGGTTNIAAYKRGELLGTCCLDIGGRLIKIERGIITYVFPKIKELAKSVGITINVGDRADEGQLEKVTDAMAAQLAQAVNLAVRSSNHNMFYTNNGKPLPTDMEIRALTFSGGVADYVYNVADSDYYRYGDVGPLLGRSIVKNNDISKVTLFTAAETIRATVVGAGTHTTEVSGSTIAYAKDILPVKNIPILRVSEEDEEQLAAISESIRRQIPLFITENKLEQIAISFTGKRYTSFKNIQALAAAVIEGAKEVQNNKLPLIVVVETDIGKVLGNAMQLLLGDDLKVVCIDGIRTLSGDYVDIGEPIAGGHVVPVVIKTLIFNS